jgi:hypothetical protein
MHSKPAFSVSFITLFFGLAGSTLIPMRGWAKVPDIAKSQWNDMQARSEWMNAHSWTGSDKEASPPLQAFVEVFTPSGEFSGFGEITIRFKSGYHPGAPVALDPSVKIHPGSARAKPEYAYVEVQGRRMFPEDTDSIRVWGIKGVPFDKSHWVFVLALGKLNVYSHFPGPAAQYFAHGEDGPESFRDSARYFGVDSLKRIFHLCPRAWAESWDDPLMGVLIFNASGDKEIAAGYAADWAHRSARRGQPTPKGKREEILAKRPYDYLLRAGLARTHCKQKQFQEAEKDLGVLRSLDSTYYQYYWVSAFCLESEGRYPESLHWYRKAAEMAPMDEGLRKDLRKTMEKIEKRAPEDRGYIREEKLPKAKSRYVPGNSGF